MSQPFRPVPAWFFRVRRLFARTAARISPGRSRGLSGPGRLIAALVLLPMSVASVPAADVPAAVVPAVAAVAKSVAPAAPATGGYTVTELGVLPGADESWPAAINNYTHVTGFSDMRSPDGRGGYVWRNGTLTELGILPEPGWIHPAAINDRGVIVGWAQIKPTDKPGQAFIWDGGAPRLLPNPNLNDECVAWGINEANEVVGSCGGHRHPYLWVQTGGVDLFERGCRISTSPEAAGQLNDINLAGEVVGWVSGMDVTPATHDAHPVLCRPDPSGNGNYTLVDIGTFGGEGVANAINDAGEVVGFTLDSMGFHIPYVWRGGYKQALQNTGTLLGYDAYDINNAGQIVGEAWENGSGEPHAVLWQGNSMTDLNTVMPDGFAYHLTQAYGINENGDIAAAGKHNVTGQRRSFLLRPPTDANLTVSLIQVTQAIQKYDNTVSLVAGKRTVARVFAKADKKPIPDVTALLYGTRDGVSLGEPLRPINNPRGRITVGKRPNLVRLDDSFNFELPESWTTGGPITLRAMINPDRSAAETNYGDNERTQASVSFQPGKTLYVRLIEYQYGSGANLAKLRPIDKELLKSELRRMYPVKDIVFHEWIWRGSVTTPVDDDDKLLAYLTGLYDTGHSNLQGELWYLMAPDNPKFIRGLANLPGRTSLGPAGDPTGSSWGWDTDGSYGDWYGAHEIGHNLGRAHTACSGGEGGPGFYPYAGGALSAAYNHMLDWEGPDYTGFDVGDPALGVPMRVYDGSWKDIMSYCNNLWISKWTWDGIYAYIRDSVHAGLQAQAAPVAGDFLSIYGTVDETLGTGELVFVARQSTAANIPPLEPGPYHIRLIDGAGETLANYPFALQPGEEIGRGTIAQVVPFMPGTRRLAIYSELAGQEIASQAVSLNPPTVAITRRDGGATLPASGPITVGWSASDLDGDALTFMLFYSPDAGATWQPLGVTSEGSLTLEAAEIPGSTPGGGRFRVQASDGVLTAEVESDAFTVPNRAPAGRISSPAAGSLASPETTLDLVGYGQDAEDGSLGSAAVSWASSLAGTLGTGSPLRVSGLVTGTHTITMTVVDSEGLSAQSAITVSVMTTPTLPTSGPLLAAAPDPLNFTFNAGAESPAGQILALRNLGAGVISYTLSSDVPWLSTSAVTGTVPSEVEVTLDSAGLYAGTHTGHVLVSSPGALNSPYTVTVRAVSSQSPVELDLRQLAFGSATAGTDGITRTLTLRNNGAPLQLAPIARGGSKPGDFVVVGDTCSGAALAPGVACQVSLRFHPSALGASSAYLTLAEDGGATWRVPLSGTGIGVPDGRYYLTILPGLGGSRSYAYGINQRGQIAGTAVGPGWPSIQRAVMWDDGVVSTLMPDNEPGSEAAAINDAGQVVGLRHGDYGARIPFVWSNGQAVDLVPWLTRANAISNRGQVTGQDEHPEEWWGERKPAVWDHGQWLPLGTLAEDDGGNGEAFGINDLGMVVGSAQFLGYNSDRWPFVWQNGQMQRLTPLTGEWNTGEARAVNNLGQIVGWSSFYFSDWDYGGYRATLWQDGTARDLGTLEPDRRNKQSRAYAINTVGQVVGSSECTGATCDLGTYTLGYDRAFIWDSGVITDLNRVLVNPLPDCALNEARGINDLGQIVGNGQRVTAGGAAVEFAFLLDPITVASDLAVQARSTSGWAAPGEVITYEVSATNLGPDPVRRLSISDTWPTGLTFAGCEAGAGGVCDEMSQATTVSFANVEPGQTVTAKIGFIVSDQATNGSRIDNVFRVAGATFDPAPANDVATVPVTVTTITAASDLRVQARSTAATVAPGRVITYEISAINLGPDPVPSLTIEDAWPAGLTQAGCQAGTGGICSHADRTTTVSFGEVAAGQTVTATIGLAVPAEAAEGERIDNTIRVRGATLDPAPANDVATVSVTVAIIRHTYLPLLKR